MKPVADIHTYIPHRLFYLFGSNDATTWNLIYQSPNITNWNSAGRKYFGLTTPVTYSAYRIVTERVGNFDVSAG